MSMPCGARAAMVRSSPSHRIRRQAAQLGVIRVHARTSYLTTTCLTAKSRDDIREIAELASDDDLLAVSELPEVPVSLEHLRDADPHTRIVVGYRLDVTPAESPRLRRRLAFPPDPGITVHIDEVVFPDTPEILWGGMRLSGTASMRT